MSKDFKNWHPRKINIEHATLRPGFHEREIWYCALGVNVGFEQDGGGINFLRPIVIVRKFNNEVFWGVPLTTSSKTGPYYFSFCFDGKTQSNAILSQIRLIDAKRLSHRVGTITAGDFIELTKKLKWLIP